MRKKERERTRKRKKRRLYALLIKDIPFEQFVIQVVRHVFFVVVYKLPFEKERYTSPASGSNDRKEIRLLIKRTSKSSSPPVPFLNHPPF